MKRHSDGGTTLTSCFNSFKPYSQSNGAYGKIMSFKTLQTLPISSSSASWSSKKACHQILAHRRTYGSFGQLFTVHNGHFPRAKESVSWASSRLVSMQILDVLTPEVQSTVDIRPKASVRQDILQTTLHLKDAKGCWYCRQSHRTAALIGSFHFAIPFGIYDGITFLILQVFCLYRSLAMAVVSHIYEASKIPF